MLQVCAPEEPYCIQRCSRKKLTVALNAPSLPALTTGSLYVVHVSTTA
jgi:hypothetical protein